MILNQSSLFHWQLAGSSAVCWPFSAEHPRDYWGVLSEHTVLQKVRVGLQRQASVLGADN